MNSVFFRCGFTQNDMTLIANRPQGVDRMAWRVPLADIDFGVEEEAAVLRVVRSRWLSMGGDARFRAGVCGVHRREACAGRDQCNRRLAHGLYRGWNKFGG
jgi:hypothetical protein